MSYRWLLLLCLLLPLSALASDVQATLDRSEAHLGETVTLNLRIGNAVNVDVPDLGALNSDFDVIGTPAVGFGLANGRPVALIGIALQPKHVGDLRIPPLNVAGAETAPLLLHVIAPDNLASTDDRKEVFIEAAAEPSQVYVGQQTFFTVRLFFDVELTGRFPDVQVDGADTLQFGQDLHYQAERNDQRYQVIERHYALIPRHPGSLIVPALQFQGEMVGTGDPNSPSSLFGNSTPVTVESTPLTLEVQAPPPNWGGTTWLPARTLALGLEGVPSDDKIHIGQPINLHMSVQATGLSADALPEPSLPAIDGATVYPDQSVDTTHDDGQWLIGRRERSFAIFPQHAGTLTIPAVTLTWFDVQSGQKQVATIPARTLTVLPAANGASAAPSSTTQSAAALVSPAAASSVAANTKADALPSTTLSTSWRWIAIASIGLWLLSAVAFWWFRKRKPADKPSPSSVPTESVRVLRKAFMDVARGRDPATQAHHLLAWARAERPGLQNLGQLSAMLASDAQRTAIEHLQRQQYAGASTGNALDLAATFAQGFVWRSDNEHDSDSPLPPLYPFKLD